MRVVHSFRLAALSVVGLSVIAGCSGTGAATGGVAPLSSPAPSASATASSAPSPVSSTPTPTATSTPSSAPTAPPPGVLSVNPPSFTLDASGDTQAVTVQETGYTGTLSETNTCGGSPVIATFSAASGTGPAWTPTVTAANAGTCSVLYVDTKGQQISQTITVSITGFTIQSTGRTR